MMDLATAALSLYLLFPLYSQLHYDFAQLLERNPKTNEQLMERRLELVKFIGGEEKADEFLADFDGEWDNEKDEPVAERTYRRSLQRMKLYEYGEEKFSLADIDRNSMSMVSINDETFVRTKFDSSFRRIEQLEWKNKESVASSVLSVKRKWTYGEKGSTFIEEDFDLATVTESVLNKKGLAVKVTKYNLEDEEIPEEENSKKDGSKKEDGSKEKKTRRVKKLASVSTYSYDNENRISEEDEKFYEEKINATTGSRRTKLVYEKRTVYAYTELSSTPDMRLYEDGQLRLVVRYSGDNSWTETVYFSKTSGIRAVYEDGTKVEENFFQESMR